MIFHITFADRRGAAGKVLRVLAAREVYSLYVERAAKGANEADGP